MDIQALPTNQPYSHILPGSADWFHSAFWFCIKYCPSSSMDKGQPDFAVVCNFIMLNVDLIQEFNLSASNVVESAVYFKAVLILIRNSKAFLDYRYTSFHI